MCMYTRSYQIFPHYARQAIEYVAVKSKKGKNESFSPESDDRRIIDKEDRFWIAPESIQLFRSAYDTSSRPASATG